MRDSWYLRPDECPHCEARIEGDQYGDLIRCWHCGREVWFVHDCCYDDETNTENCFEYVIPGDDA